MLFILRQKNKRATEGMIYQSGEREDDGRTPGRGTTVTGLESLKFASAAEGPSTSIHICKGTSLVHSDSRI